MLSARQGEDSAVIEMKSMGELEPLDEDSLKESRELCKALGGHVVVWSESDKRVRLVNLPFSTDKPAEQAPSPALRRGAEGRGKSILLVDDEETVRGFLKRGLEIDGHAVVTASDGSDGLDRLNEADGGFDLMLTDIRMPLMDGIALALAAKRDFPDLTILLMTGFADQRERARGLDAIVTDVLTKPFSLADLRATVKRALAA